MKKKLSYLLAIVFFLFLIYFGIFRIQKIPNFFFLFTNLFIIFFTFFLILKNKRNFSLKNIVYIFILIFFGLSPLYQINTNFYTWGIFLTEKETIISNITIILILFIIHLLSRPLYFSKSSKLKMSNKIFSEEIKKFKFTMPISYQFYIFFFFLLLFFLLFQSYNFNFINFLYRSGEVDNGFIWNQTAYLFFSYLIRPLIFNLFIVFFFIKNRVNFLFYIISIFSIFAVFPTGVPRFFAATMYLTFIFILINLYSKKDISLFFVILIGLIFIFPLLDIFRWFSSNSSLVDYNFNIDLHSGNFDAYGMFTLALNRGNVLFGKNILTAIFFFIPRSLWLNKEIGSGALISENLSLDLDNVSMPYFAEGYLAFGFFGLITFVIILSRLIYKIDDKFYTTLVDCDNKNPMIFIIYLNLLFLLFFIMRGDLLSSFAYLIGITFSNISLYIFIKNIIKNQV